MEQHELRHRTRQHRKSVISLLAAIHEAKRGHKMTIMCISNESRQRLFEQFRQLAKEHDFEYRIKCNEFHAVEGEGVVYFVIPKDVDNRTEMHTRGLPDAAPSS